MSGEEESVVVEKAFEEVVVTSEVVPSTSSVPPLEPANVKEDEMDVVLDELNV